MRLAAAVVWHFPGALGEFGGLASIETTRTSTTREYEPIYHFIAILSIANNGVW
jgi:hypothetical protein